MGILQHRDNSGNLYSVNGWSLVRCCQFCCLDLEGRSKKQEARSKKQEARSKKQEARSKKQEARSKKQEARSKKLDVEMQ